MTETGRRRVMIASATNSPLPPAYAGLTRSAPESSPPWRLYPRIRGADILAVVAALAWFPPPPHTRG